MLRGPAIAAVLTACLCGPALAADAASPAAAVTVPGTVADEAAADPVSTAAGPDALADPGADPAGADSSGADPAAVAGAPADAPTDGAHAAVDPATLADLRAQLTDLSAQLRDLRAQLKASGRRGFAAAGGDAAIDRMNAMERQLSRLTGETERLSNRIDRIVRDGTNRLADIEFRLCEMEEGCDLGALTTPGPLGGGVAAMGGAVPPAARAAADVPLTAAERTAFDAASAALQAGDFPRAAELFGDFARQHAGSPATAEAQFLRGAALDSAGDPAGATAAWLSAFAAAPGGPRAPDALLGLSRVAAVGKAAGAGCVYIAELAERFPGTPQADESARRGQAAGCQMPDDAVPGQDAPGQDVPGQDAPDLAVDGGALPAGASVPGDGG